MTNQNDTQDEAERLDHPCRQTCSGWKQGHDKGYRAGQETREHELDVSEQAFKLAIKECKALIEENEMLRKGSEAAIKEIMFMQEKQIPALQEELNQSKRETQAAVHLCEQARAEVEQLNKLLKLAMNERRYYYDLLEEEQAKAPKLVEAAKGAVKFMEAHKYHDYDESEPEFQMMASLESALDDYSTDSGDGGGK